LKYKKREAKNMNTNQAQQIDNGFKPTAQAMAEITFQTIQNLNKYTTVQRC